MSHKIIICTLLYFLFFSNAEAQDKSFEYQKEVIRNIYAYAQKEIKYSEEFSNTNTVVYERMIPALGGVKTTIKLYGDEELITDMEQTYPWQSNGKKTLVFVTVLVECSCAADEYIEYLFDPESQQLLFSFIKNPYPGEEQRYYYNLQNRLFHHTVKSDSNGNGIIEFTTNKTAYFTSNELEKSKKQQNKALEYLRMFEQIYNLEKLEKR